MCDTPTARGNLAAPPNRRQMQRITAVIAAVALAIETGATLGLLVDERFVIIAMLACAALTLTSGYAAYRGIDATLRGN